MLYQATLLVDLTAMAICLWMAFYLFARGFPTKITLLATLGLLALSVNLFGVVNNIFHQVVGDAALRASLLIIVLTMWYSITLQLLPAAIRRSLRWMTLGLYSLAFVTAAILILTPNAFVGEVGNALYVAHMRPALPYYLYEAFNILIASGILYNLLSHNKVGLIQEGRYFLFASIFPIFAIIYAALVFTRTTQAPRIIMDVLVFSGVFFLGLSVARFQSLVERRTTLQDFPVTTLTILLLTFAYILIAFGLGLPLQSISYITAFVVLTHAVYDLVREFLERLRIRDEGAFRKQLRQLESESSSENAFRLRLQKGLDLLCNTLDASNGFIAVKQGDEFVVTASRQSTQLDRHFSSSAVSYEDISQAQNDQLPDIQYFAPSFDGQTQIAVLGIGKPKTRLDYSHGDLDLLSEVADHVGTIVSLSSLQPRLSQIITQSELNEKEANLIAGEMIDAMGISPDQEFIKVVEEGLRHISDYITLGQSPLADKLEVKAESHIERGRELQKTLMESIELLRPAEKRPPEPLPRVWYNHAVLHDAYVEGVPNREIMARLYISEGTFNRTRRNAIRGLARLLMEKKSAVK